MFGIFGQSTKVTGIDIRSDCIRFLELDNKDGVDRISAYGEIIFEGIELNDEKLIQYFRDIKKNLKSRVINVSIPVGSDNKKCFEILKSAGLKPNKIVTPSTPLEISLVPDGAETSFLVVETEKSQTNYLVFAPIIDSKFYTSDGANHSIISNLNRLYIDWYDRHKARIDHVIFCGSRASDEDFIDYISRETKIAITVGNIFTNLNIDTSNVPMINKKDSYKYAVAMGLAMM